MPGLSERLRQGRFSYFPVVPGRLEFAVALRRRIVNRPPSLIALELPERLEQYYRKAVDRLPQMSVLMHVDEEEEEAIFLPVEPADPFTEAVRSGVEMSAKLLFIEPPTFDRPHIPQRYPDTYSLQTIGYDAYVEAYLDHAPPPSPEVVAHAQAMAYRLQGTDPAAEVLVVVALNVLPALLRAMEVPQEDIEVPAGRRLEVQLINPHPDCLAEICHEYPFLQERYEQYRLLMEPELIDRLRTQFALFRAAEQSYTENTGDQVQHWHRRLLARYSRNLAFIDQDLVPGLFDLVTAARSIVDDNYGWEVWDTANRYPSQRETNIPETLNLSGEDVFFNTRKLRLRRRLPRERQRMKPQSLKPRQKERREGEWAEELNGDAICSYPPEDLVIEDFGRFLKQHAHQIVSGERQRVEAFSTSMLDGIDLRETMRNWHEGQIYVRELERGGSDVGSVVVVFDEDREDRYRYLTTWLGEHQNESDMAFYSTHPFDHIVGPGIGRAEYGGFLMSLPARRMYDIWRDPYYDPAETKAERLLMAGLDYSVKPAVVYMAPKPPRSAMRSLAARMGRRILYIPLGQMNSTKLKKVRVVHVLDGYHRRETAKDYLW